MWLIMSELPWTSTIQVNRLFDLLDEGLVVLDNTGVIVHSNQTFADFLQYSAGDLIDRRFEGLISEDERGLFVSHLSNGRGLPLTLTLRTSEGDEIPFDVKSLNLVEEGLPKGFCLVITESASIDMSFKEIIDGAFLRFMTVDLKLNVSYVNRAFRKGASEIIGRSVLDTVATEFRLLLKEKLEVVLNTGQFQLVEIVETLPDKPETWHGLRIGPIRDGDQTIGAVIVAYDITEKIAALQGLQESEEKFRGVFEQANEAITLTDEEGRIIEMNPAMEQLFGIKKEDAIGAPYWKIQSSLLSEGEKKPELEKELESMLVSLFETGTAPWLERKTRGEFIHPVDKTKRFFEQTVFTIPSAKGFKLCSFAWDITEETERTEALKRIETRHQQALLGSDLGVWEWVKEPGSGESNWHVNEHFAAHMGYDAEELENIFLDYSSIAHPDDYAEVKRQWMLHESGEIPHYSVEYRFKTKSGDWRWILDRGKVTEWDENGIARKSSGTFLDITERKEAQAKLDGLLERYELALKGADLGVWDWDAEKDEMIFSDRWADILGYKVDEIDPNYAGWEKLVHPDDIKSMESKWNAHVEGATDFYSSEHRMRTKTGSWKWVLERGRVVEWNDEGGTKRATGTLLDITERQEVAKALQTERSVFHDLAKAAIQTKDTKELSRELLNNIISTLRFDFGTFRIYDEQKNVLQYSALLGTKIEDTLDEIPVTPEYSRDYIIVQAASTKTPIFIENLNEYEELSYLSRLRKLQAASVIAFPILDDDEQLLGVFSLATRSPRLFSDGDKALYWTIANMLGGVLERKKAEAALQISERRYRDLLTDMSEGMCIVDLDEKILFANQSFAEILGYAVNDLESKSILELVHPDDVPEILNQTNLRRDGQTSTYTHRLIREDGESRTVRVSAVPSRDDYGQIDGTVAVITDITERLMAEEALKESELKFRRVFESMPLALHLLSYDGEDEFTLIDANPAADSLLRTDHSKYLGKKLSEIPHPHNPANMPDELKGIILSGDSWETNQVVYDGDKVQVAMEAQVFRTSKDTLVASFLDVTERVVKDFEIKKLNENLARMVDERTAELAAANKELESFAYSVSHDLRAPLRTIDGFSQALQEDYSESLDSTALDHLKRVRSAATQMGSLIEDLLILSRVTRAEMDRKEVNLSEIARSVVDEMRDNDPEREVDVSVADSLTVRCDERLIKLVIQNLLDNAWKFTDNTSNPQIEFGSEVEDGETHYYVKDNGAGFDMEYSDKLFLPFQRLHSVEDFEGAGIGLATVQRVINRHGGRVWAESVVGEGSTFYFTLSE